jgi:hypothetical protein
MKKSTKNKKRNFVKKYMDLLCVSKVIDTDKKKYNRKTKHKNETSKDH